MAKDQIGCRFLQKKFAEGAPEDIERIFVEIIGHIVELMTDPFGNYLVQKLLEVCNEDQRMCILCTVTRKMGELFRISCDMHGYALPIHKLCCLHFCPFLASVLIAIFQMQNAGCTESN